ncbi:threonine ammonia-lyase [Acidocella aminolytica]|uniref:Threonine dehydratase n=1 Tax=Acidocella aminolytica 101 = DSM 11237 TaxID=1120923 RepID=A0A0D6PD00_9PROT|nr:threonine ammonia-lyase [Acidocella aminolytica]GAN78734.1 threonine dehydratase [Acidocella aminolytica 101 = DSM 11237]GBQ38721.1 threonine dehydratase [Acidocella aminolytica 101 = DSM 11237]SHE78825.1 threonine dehydratase [Acidocella aminolytica 101 = DSM 11237]
MITYDDVLAASKRIQGAVLRSPFLRMEGLSRLTGAELYVKLDHLQSTGAFKERGAANRIALLTDAERKRGVVAMSAGNHAQAVARHAMLAGIKATIVMPRHTPATKVTRTASWGAHVVLHGDTLAEAAAEASRLEKDEGLFFIHPYDDPAVMAGQGTMALEMFQDVPDLDALVVATGGGGLIAGSAVVARHLRPECKVYGVEVEHYAAFAQALSGQEIKVGGPTIAEGIAVRDIGQRPLAVMKALDVPMLVVTEHAVESAIDAFVENAKQVTEGAGAASLAAVLSFPEHFRGKKVGISICGANIDPRILANTLMRCLLRDGRMLRLVLEMPDRPGMLAEVSKRIGELGGNILEVSHHRLFSSPSVQDAQLEVMIEARDVAHGEAIEASLAEVFVLRRL